MTHRLPIIPNDWTPKQALAVYEMVDALRDAIWASYNPQLIELMREAHEREQEQITSFMFDDDLEF